MCLPVKKSAIVVLLIFLLSVLPASALLNPSSVYCSALGYTPDTLIKANGNEYGVCRLPNNMYADSWDFLRGQVAQKYNYCIMNGYISKTSTDPKTCNAIKDTACTVCVLPDHREVEVTTLMNLSFAETTCGDGRCVITENFKNCPVDCPQSGPDDNCQGLLDFKCDTDCIGGKGDFDCLYLKNPLGTMLVIVVVLALAAGACWYFRKKKR